MNHVEVYFLLSLFGLAFLWGAGMSTCETKKKISDSTVIVGLFGLLLLWSSMIFSGVYHKEIKAEIRHGLREFLEIDKPPDPQKD